MREFLEVEIGIGLESGEVKFEGIETDNSMGVLKKRPHLGKILFPETGHLARDFLELVVKLAVVNGADGDAETSRVVVIQVFEDFLGFNVENDFVEHNLSVGGSRLF